MLQLYTYMPGKLPHQVKGEKTHCIAYQEQINTAKGHQRKLNVKDK